MKARQAPKHRVRVFPDHQMGKVIDEMIGEDGGPEDGDGILAFVTRVGDADFVPPRYELNSCYLCGHPVWISSEAVEGARRHRLDLICICQVCQ